MEGEVEYLFVSYCQCPSPQWIEVPASQHRMVGWRCSPSNDTLQYPAALQKRNIHVYVAVTTSVSFDQRILMSSKTQCYNTSVL